MKRRRKTETDIAVGRTAKRGQRENETVAREELTRSACASQHSCTDSFVSQSPRAGLESSNSHINSRLLRSLDELEMVRQSLSCRLRDQHMDTALDRVHGDGMVSAVGGEDCDGSSSRKRVDGGLVGVRVAPFSGLREGFESARARQSTVSQSQGFSCAHEQSMSL